MDARRAVITPGFIEALNYAMGLHAQDQRKGTTVPYAAHLLGVCALVLVDGGSEEEAMAALLHDALEDHPDRTSSEEIRARFGAHVLALVEACTDTPPGYKGGAKPPWRQRKAAYLEHLRSASAGELRVSLADKLDNARAILADYRQLGEGLWSRFNAGREDQLWSLRSLVQAYREAGKTGPNLEEFERTVDELHRLAGPSTSELRGG